MNKRDRRGVALAMALLAALVLGIGTGGVAAVLAGGRPATAQSAAQPTASASAPAAVSSAAPPASAGTGAAVSYDPLPLPEEMRAMWFSFLEWRDLFAAMAENGESGEAAFTQRVGQMFQNSADMGMNTVIAVVRPFGDALYPSQIYPWSHVLNPDGTQGVDPGFDPLAVMVNEAHARGLRIEAWVNPYRVSNTVNGPQALSSDNPAAQSPDWLRDVNGNLWYDPGYPQTVTWVVQGVAEILQNYAVDGIHLDDYFYPEDADETFDEASFAAYNECGYSLADWRRDNVNTMVRGVYEAVKSLRPGASFGISTQGNNENNYTQMYADVKHWMSNEGYVDYVMPQLYWGFGYRTQSGRESYAFANIASEWAFYPRLDSVRLYAGLGAYRIGKYDADTGERTELGDGGNNDQAEWESGHNLADMVQHLRGQAGFSGFALFRYDYLFQPGDTLGEAERAALAGALAPPPEEDAGASSSLPPG